MEQEHELSNYKRYQRQAIIPGIGWSGQRRLREARVLVIGAGGLGSPIILYLGAAGIGTIGIVDGDVVEESNLNRQVIHMTDRIGDLKTTSARVFLSNLNPDVHVDEHPVFLDPENAEMIIGKNEATIREWQRIGPAPILIDIREIEPRKEEKIPGALWMHINQLDVFMQTHTVTESTPIILICSLGIRSQLHAEALRITKHKNTYSMEGGAACMLQPSMN